MNADEWLLELDFIDPFFSAPAELEKMVETAPSIELRDWLASQQAENAKFMTMMFQ